MSQVHKEQLSGVDNALPNRSSLDVEIFGMEGVPEDIIQGHNQRVLTQFHQAEAERQAVTGNPPSGSTPGQAPASKKPKTESVSDMKKRLAEHKAKRAEALNGMSSGEGTPVGQTPTPGGFVSFFLFSFFSIMIVVYTDLSRANHRRVPPWLTNNSHTRSRTVALMRRISKPPVLSTKTYHLLVSRNSQRNFLPRDTLRNLSRPILPVNLFQVMVPLLHLSHLSNLNRKPPRTTSLHKPPQDSLHGRVVYRMPLAFHNGLALPLHK